MKSACPHEMKKPKVEAKVAKDEITHIISSWKVFILKNLGIKPPDISATTPEGIKIDPVVKAASMEVRLKTISRYFGAKLETSAKNDISMAPAKAMLSTIGFVSKYKDPCLKSFQLKSVDTSVVSLGVFSPNDLLSF